MYSRNKRILNLTDILLITFALVTVGALALFLFSGGTDYDFSAKKDVLVHIKAYNTHDYGITINNGDKIFDTSSGEFIGHVERVIYNSVSESILDSETDNEKTFYHPELVNIDLYLKATVSEMSGFGYKIGQKINLNSPYVAFSGVIGEVKSYDNNMVVFSNDITFRNTSE